MGVSYSDTNISKRYMIMEGKRVCMDDAKQFRVVVLGSPGKDYLRNP
jgi:hypothetical protein